MEKNNDNSYINEDTNSAISNNTVSMRPFVLIGLMILVTMLGMLAFKFAFLWNNNNPNVQNSTSYSKYYAIITSDSNSDFWKEIYVGAKNEGEESDSYVEMFADNLGRSYTVEEKMEIAIASDVDGIIIEGMDSEGLRKQIGIAKERGIPVVTAIQDTTSSERISFIGVSKYELGQKYGKETYNLANNLLSAGDKEKINILVLISDDSEGNGQNLLLSGIREELAIDESVGAKLELQVKTIDDKGSFTAEESIRDIFVGNEEKPDILVCLSQIHTTCAAQAVVDYNCVGQTNIIGSYDSELILNNIEKEIIYSTISMDGEQMGKYCVSALDEFNEFSYANDYYAVDTYIVNGKNISQYIGGANEEDN